MHEDYRVGVIIGDIEERLEVLGGLGEDVAGEGGAVGLFDYTEASVIVVQEGGRGIGEDGGWEACRTSPEVGDLFS